MIRIDSRFMRNLGFTTTQVICRSSFRPNFFWSVVPNEEKAPSGRVMFHKGEMFHEAFGLCSYLRSRHLR